ncbi:Monoterpene epsilon-lactone hydrolase [bacterium HR25]|jgi:acetyl esterase/lipase|nr:Monoterpene epsilon-lactone hydrolase [bacterium HR25]
MPSAELEKAMQIWRETGAALGQKTYLWEMRFGFEEMWARFSRPPQDVKYEPVGAGGVRAEWVVPQEVSDDRTILYLHGGGYVLCSPHTHREMVAHLAKAARARALLIDYRLAPEHPFPAAVEDSLAAYRWLLGQGVRPQRIAIAGDSAGGGLTVATLVGLRYTGQPLPAAGVCFSPWTDLACTGETLTTKAQEDPIVQKPLVEQLAQMYLAGADPKAPLASPLYADLTGLPPLLVQVGTAETLLDDSTRLVERARRAEVDVTLEVWEGMPHVWHFFVSFLPEAQQAVQKAGEFIQRHTA